MSLSGKALGYKILVANTISLFLFLFAFSSANLQYSADIPQELNNTPKYNPSSYSVSGWNPPTTGISAIDWLLAFYYIFSYGVAIWLIANPFSG